MKKQLISFALSMALSLTLLNGITVADNTVNYGYIDHPVSVDISTPSTMKGASAYPQYYNSYEHGLMSDAKDQSTTDTCWIFTHNELIETRLRKDGEGDYDFSEQTVKFETSYITDKYGYLKYPNSGGNEYMSTAYLARMGLVLESEEPFSVSEDRTVNPDTLTRYGHLNSVSMINYGDNSELEYRAEAIDKIKKYVLEYGAVGTSIYYENSQNYMTDDRSNYYYNGTFITPNHAITIVGWDDNYPASNFRHTPKGNGAFIVKNSWGNTHNNDTSCYLYVSYYDKLVTSELYVTDYDISNDTYDNIYQYDYHGWTGSGSVRGNSVITITNYTAKSAFESVTAVSTYVVSPDTTVEVLLCVNGGDITNEKNYISVCKKTFEEAGYYYIEFDPVKLEGLKYAVALRYTTTLETTQFPICANYPGLVNNAVNVPDTCYVATEFSNAYPIENIKSYKNVNAMLCMKSFTKSIPDTTENIDSSDKFTDIKKDKWYTEAVSYAVTYGIFGGVTDTTFEPDTNMTRAMFVRTLANIQGVKLDDYKTTEFDDVELNRWYTGAVSWAAKNGIVLGVTDIEFKPYDTVTRQQMCVMLVRYCDYLGITLEETVDAVTFKDETKIQAYAKDAVYICQRAGIIKGVTADTFEPRSGATRAQVANMMMNFCKKYVYR